MFNVEEGLKKNPDFYRKIVVAIFTLGLLLRSAMAFVTPAWSSPDEYAHYWVAEQIVETGRLPLSRPDFPRYEAYQPPLYYLSLAGVIQIIGTSDFSYEKEVGESAPLSLVLLRSLSILFGMLTLFFGWKILQRIEWISDAVRLGSLAFMGLLPTYIGVTSSLNNDGLVVLLSTLAIYVLLRSPLTITSAFSTGLFLGLALLTKMTGIVVAPFIGIYLLQHYRKNRPALIQHVLFIAVGASIGIALLLARNIAQYDSLLALVPGVERGWDFSPMNIVHALRNLFGSFWFAFGRVYEIQLPIVLYALLFIPLTLIGILGNVRRFAEEQTFLTIIGSSILFSILFSLSFTLSFPAGTQTSWGKNLYPLLPILALFFSYGWRNLTHKTGSHLLWSGLLILLGSSLWGLIVLW